MNSPILPRSDGSEFRKRYRWIALFAFSAFGLIVCRLFQLQIVNGATYAETAHENIIRRVPLSTTRGIIRDTHRKILASSRPAYNVYIVPGRVMPSARPRRRRGDVGETTDTWPAIADTLRLNPEERAQFESAIYAACTTDEDNSQCWRPILAREDLSRDLVAEFKQHQTSLNGAEIINSPVRYYPYKQLGAHVLGYVSEIDAETLGKIRPPGYEHATAEERQALNPSAYEPGDIIGATGIERAWESHLRGQIGWEKRVVDARGRYRSGPETEHIIDMPARQEPLPGRNLRLTIDIDLEQSVEAAMRPHAAGAVVIVDVKSGRLLSVYSKPNFDPNDLSGGNGKIRKRESFNRLYTNDLRPMLDKTISGSFQPGSTFKPFSALAALENQIIDANSTVQCNYTLTFGRRVFHCSHYHGMVDMRLALAESCNIYFYKLAEAVGMDRIAKIASDFGLGARTGLGVNPESPGLIPTRALYALQYRGQFRLGFTLNAAIGEGATTVTPLQLALAYAAIANGGTLYFPQLIESLETSDNSIIQDFAPRERRTIGIQKQNLAHIVEGLYGVVNDPKGTAYPVRDPTLDIAGKTGTAQTGYIPSEDDDVHKTWYNMRDHAWFASYYPAKNPEIAVIVLIEHGGAGPTQAAPVGIQIIRDYASLVATRTHGNPEIRTAVRGTH